MAKRLTPEERVRQRQQVASEFFTNVLAKIPDEAKRQEILTTLQAHPDALAALGDGVLRDREFSRFMDDARAQQQETMQLLTAQKASLDNWWKDNSSVVTRATALEQEVADLRRRLGGRPGNGDADEGTADDLIDPLATPPARRPAPPQRPALSEPAVDTTKFLSREEAERALQDHELNQLKFQTMLAKLMHNHSREFDGEVLDADDLVEFAKDNGMRLDLAYDQYVRERRDKAQQAQVEERIKKAREEGLMEGRAQAQATPYPVSDEANIFANIRTDRETPKSVADIAADVQRAMLGS